MEVLGNAWGWGARFEIFKESIQNFVQITKQNKNNNMKEKLQDIIVC